MTSTGDSGLPDLFARWLGGVLGEPLTGEPGATCHACPQLAPVAPGRVRFDADSKCCTYQPLLANFLVGAILRDGDPSPVAVAGRRSVEERIARTEGVTPLGVRPPISYLMMYGHLKQRMFGRALGLRCPHYVDDDGGTCGIWNHRNAVCSTWFCKHERGVIGFELWGAVRELLIACERAVAAWCVHELDLGDEALALTFAGDDYDALLDELGKPPDLAAHRAMWGAYAGREREAYARAAELAAPLAWADVLRLGGAEVEARARDVVEAAARHRTHVRPAIVRVGPHNVLAIDADNVELSTYAEHDPVEVPAALVPALRRFDGRPLVEVLAELRASVGLDLAPALVNKLVDFHVLIGEPEPHAPT